MPGMIQEERFMAFLMLRGCVDAGVDGDRLLAAALETLCKARGNVNPLIFALVS